MKLSPTLPALLTFLTSLASCSAFAQTHLDAAGTVVTGVYDVSNATHPYAYCQLTVGASPVTLSSLLATAGCGSIPPWVTAAYVTPESNSQVAIRYRSDGQAPSSSAGQPVFGWQNWPLLGLTALNNLSLISATGAPVTIDIEFRG